MLTLRSLGHDLRNALNLIVGYSDLLSDGNGIVNQVCAPTPGLKLVELSSLLVAQVDAYIAQLNEADLLPAKRSRTEIAGTAAMLMSGAESIENCESAREDGQNLRTALARLAELLEQQPSLDPLESPPAG